MEHRTQQQRQWPVDELKLYIKQEKGEKSSYKGDKLIDSELVNPTYEVRQILWRYSLHNLSVTTHMVIPCKKDRFSQCRCCHYSQIFTSSEVDKQDYQSIILPSRYKLTELMLFPSCNS